MNKTLTVMTGLGLGAVLVCLFERAKRRPRGGPICDEATHAISNAEDMIDARSPFTSRQTFEDHDAAIHGRNTSRHGITEAAVNDYVMRSGRPGLDELPQTGSSLVYTRGTIHGGRSCDFRQVGNSYGAGSARSLAQRTLPVFVRAVRPVYRLLCRFSFGLSLCAAGLEMLKRVFADKPAGRAASSGYKKLSNGERVLITGLVSLAFLSRLSILRLSRDTLTPDGVYYATLGKRLAAGDFREGLSTFWPPLYPLLVGVSSLFARDVEIGGRLVSVVAGSLLVVPVYLLTKLLYGLSAASVGALLIAAHPILIHYSTLLLTESTYTLLFTTAVLAGLLALSSLERRAFFAAGVALGACYLTRPEAVGYAGLMVALTMRAHLSANNHPPSAVVPNVLGLLLGFSLLALPYILFLRRATGRRTVSDKLRDHVLSTDNWVRKWFGLPDGQQTTLADRLYAGVPQAGALSDSSVSIPADTRGLRHAAGRSAAALKLELRLMIYHLIPPPLMVLLGLGLFKAEWPQEIYLLSFTGAALLGYALCPDVVNERMMVPLVPLSICWAAKGAGEVEAWLSRLLVRMGFVGAGSFKNHSPLRPLVMAALLLSMLPWIGYTLMRRLPREMPEHRQAGTWMREHAEGPALIMATDPHAAFYAGGSSLYLPVEEYATVIGHARRHAVDYLVIDEEVVSQNVEYANLRFLLDEQSRHPELKLVYKLDGVPHRKILIFTLT